MAKHKRYNKRDGLTSFLEKRAGSQAKLKAFDAKFKRPPFKVRYIIRKASDSETSSTGET